MTIGYCGHRQVKRTRSRGGRSNQGIDRRIQSQAGQDGGNIPSLGRSDTGMNYRVYLRLYNMGSAIRYIFYFMLRLIVASRLPVPFLFRVDVTAIVLVP